MDSIRDDDDDGGGGDMCVCYPGVVVVKCVCV